MKKNEHGATITALNAIESENWGTRGMLRRDMLGVSFLGGLYFCGVCIVVFANPWDRVTWLDMLLLGLSILPVMTFLCMVFRKRREFITGESEVEIEGTQTTKLQV